MEKLQEKSLLLKAKKGNNKAFVELLQNEKLKLYKMAYIYMKNENDALDVVQETIARAYSNIHTVKEERYFATWLMRILINTAIEMLRKNQKNSTYLGTTIGANPSFKL